jgi:hypothetical protein
MNFTSIRKTIINVLTVVVTAGPWILNALGMFPGGEKSAAIVSAVLGVAGVILHYLVPNTTTDPSVAAVQSVKLVNPKPVA